MFGFIIGAVVIVVVFWLIASYNGLVTLRMRAKEAWSDIDIQLKRRYDLIPNLIETVKGYASHESNVFQKVTEARVKAIATQGMSQKAQAENQLSEALKSLFAVSESYPDLKASANFLQLQTELTDTEDKIQASRRFYNANVRDLNIQVQVFPTNLIAKQLGFSEMELFEVADAKERENVSVKF
jgi:LemA protein